MLHLLVLPSHLQDYFKNLLKHHRSSFLQGFLLPWVYQNNFKDGTCAGDDVQTWGKGTESFRHTNGQVFMQEIGFNGFLWSGRSKDT